MERPHGETRESPPQTKGKALPLKLTREMLFLAEQAAEGRLKVLPGKDWALHYPAESEDRAEKLQGLLEGKYTAQDVAHDIKPDALFYNAQDLEKQGLENVSARVRDLSAFITHYDYPRFARFVESMRGRNIPIDELDRLYTEITQARVQKKVMDAYGYTGKKQIESALRNEADTVVQGIQNLPRSQKVLKALKTNWLSEELGLVAPDERDRVISELSGDERRVFESLQSSYREYIQRGDENAYKELIKTIQEDFPKIQKQIETGQPSESMQELQKELEEYQDRATQEQHAGDLAAAPDEQDELYTNLPETRETGAEREKLIFFEITPPLNGYYHSGVKSYYDIDKKTWRKNKQLIQYNGRIDGKTRHTIKGTTRGGLKAIPIPGTYAIDYESLQYTGSTPEIFRDQYGCFYIKTDGACDFHIDFLHEPQLFIYPPIKEDMEPMYRGTLSPKTEGLIGKLNGSNLQKAEQVRQYISAHHFYPGGGDLKTAKALQLKLLSESTGDNYVQNLDNSEYLECRSADTLGAAICRKAGMPVRFVVGDHPKGANDGKTLIDETTGHAWTEIWDGTLWRRFDFTPNPKPEDKTESQKKEEEKKSKQEQAEEAKDGGVDKPQEKEGTEGEQKDDQKQSQKPGEQKGQEPSESGNPLEQMSEASDNDLQKSESQLQQAREQMDRMMQQKQQLDEKVKNAEKFKELSELKKELEESGLLDDLKKEIEEKLEAKEDQMKDTIKDELDKMVEDGFMDEKKRDEILRELEKKQLEELDRVQKEVEQENRLYNEYEDIREEVVPLVDKWFRYFAERLPRQEEASFDEDSLTRQGAFNRRAVMKPRNLLFGMVKNPREIKPSIKPRFMASVLVDVSGSMAGEKLKSARKLLVFYSELFSRISEAFGYIRFSIDTFSDSVTEIKGFIQDYDSPQRYDFPDGTRSTIKVRLMQRLATQGGTNMLDGIKKTASELNKQTEEYPDYASAFYFVGDGGDTHGNAANIKRFLQINESEHGFGEHMYSAILLGTEAQRRELAEIFGDEHTNVAPDFDELIEKSMDKFNDDLEDYLKAKIQ